MGNMSYCRYQNTSGDLQDCIDSLENPEYKDEAYHRLPHREKMKADEMREQCETYIRIYDEVIEREEEDEEDEEDEEE